MSFSRLKMPSKKHPKSREAGIALIAVLWALLLLSALAATVEYIARTNAILRHRSVELAQADAAAESAFTDVVAKLSDDRPSRRPVIDGQAHTSTYQDFTVTVSISNEAGRINVNTADSDLISAFLESQGLSEPRAANMVSDLRSSQSKPLVAIEELRRLPSWNIPALNCWPNALTVYSDSTGVSEKDASAEVAAAFQWAREHRTGGKEWTPTTKIIDLPSDNLPLGKVLRIRVTASMSAHVVSTLEWIGRITGDASKPFLTMRWDKIPTASPFCSAEPVRIIN
jgi:hypothetical protein